MRKIIFAIFILAFHCISIYSVGNKSDWRVAPSDRYAKKSVLSNGTWVKVRVTNNGIYKVTYEELQSMGITSPENVRVHGYGGAMLEEQFDKPYIDDLPEVSVYMHKGSDGVFGKGDYILFYAQGSIKWVCDNSKFIHSQNAYSDHGYYFITSGKQEGKRIYGIASKTGNTKGEITTFTDYYLHELDQQNLLYSGKEYYGETFSGSRVSYDYTINIPNLKTGKATLIINVAGRSPTTSSIITSCNGIAIDTLSIPTTSDIDYITKARSAKSAKEFTLNGGRSININIKYTRPTAIAWLNYFTLNVNRELSKESGEPLFFRNIDNLFSSDLYKYKVQNVSKETQIWDITDKFNSKSITLTEEDRFSVFVDEVSSLKEYVAINPYTDKFNRIQVVERVDNQNLHSLYGVDMIIIAHNDFIDAAKRLAQWHSDNDGLRVVVTDAVKIYNEFSSGTPDATAYRRYVKMFYDRSESATDAPKYLLLFGDGSFDNRQILSSATDKNIYRLLTYQSTNSLSTTGSYATDDYFALLDDTDGLTLESEKMDLSVGRIPVYTREQAEVVVDKMISYMQNDQLGTWKNRLVFMADDGDNNEHISSADEVADMTQKLFPNMEVKKIYLDAYKQEVTAVGESYPAAKKEFDSYIKEGTLLINYMGHGGYNGWANEQILSSADIENMYNKHLPLWVTATCDFSRFDDFKDSGGERLLFNPNGGAMGLFTTSRTVYALPNKRLNVRFMKVLQQKDSNGDYISIGEAVRLAKNEMVGDDNRLSFILLGNPAMKLALPNSHDVTIDSINGKVFLSDNTDTIKALEEISLKGSLVLKNTREKDKLFNGIVYITVFDKEERYTTLANDLNSKPYSFMYRNSRLFHGSVEVRNGEYSIIFRLPKDIKYNYGTAKIMIYAYDLTNGYEANGSTDSVIIGGENLDVEKEEQGPSVEMYMNTQSFVSGDKLNSSPLFIAKVYDESGINTVGSGIGHDMILRLNNDPKQEYILNSYYTSILGDYKRGYVNYDLENLPDGNYELMFRVWDLMNNSTTSYLNFVVSRDIKPTLISVFTYPNPTTDIVNFVFSHDRPNTLVGVKVDIYDFSGQYIWTSEKKTITDNSGNSEIQWNLQGTSGIKVGAGIYLAKIVFIDINEKMDIKTTKIVVR